MATITPISYKRVIAELEFLGTDMEDQTIPDYDAAHSREEWQRSGSVQRMSTNASVGAISSCGVAITSCSPSKMSPPSLTVPVMPID